MLISGLQPLTLVDFPGKVACTIYTLGCNFRCHYCYNSEFVLPEKVKKLRPSCISVNTVYSFLKHRKNLLQWICVTWGEPTIHRDLPGFLSTIKQMWFAVKLDTNGSNPHVLEKIIQMESVDYVAMDIKAAPCDYEAICWVPGYEDAISESKKILEKSGVAHEFRTVMIPRFHDDKRKKKLYSFIGTKSHHRLLEFTSKNGCLNPQWEQD